MSFLTVFFIVNAKQKVTAKNAFEVPIPDCKGLSDFENI